MKAIGYVIITLLSVSNAYAGNIVPSDSPQCIVDYAYVISEYQLYDSLCQQINSEKRESNMYLSATRQTIEQLRYALNNGNMSSADRRHLTSVLEQMDEKLEKLTNEYQLYFVTKEHDLSVRIIKDVVDASQHVLVNEYGRDRVAIVADDYSARSDSDYCDISDAVIEELNWGNSVVNVAGVWHGRLLQQISNGRSASARVSLFLHQNGTQLTGTSRIENGSGFVVMNLVGTATADGIVFCEQNVRTSTNRRAWLLKIGNLKRNGNTLSGTWAIENADGTGTIALTR